MNAPIKGGPQTTIKQVSKHQVFGRKLDEMIALQSQPFF